jgi:hypothetical protein
MLHATGMQALGHDDAATIAHTHGKPITIAIIGHIGMQGCYLLTLHFFIFGREGTAFF